MFAVRQWPGNGADLDFRGVLGGCTAAIVAAAPIEGTLLNGERYNGKEGMNIFEAREAFLKSDEYAAVAKVLPFCRLWCVRGGGHLSPLTFSPQTALRLVTASSQAACSQRGATGRS